jgi:hypothetical protein
VYQGDTIPQSEDDLHLHFNLWLLDAAPAQNQEVEVIIARVEAPLQTSTVQPTITMTATNNIVQGTVSPAEFCTADYRVILYALTDIYYIQPTTADPTIAINQDCTWQAETHYWQGLAAHLVRSDYSHPLRIRRQECPPLDPISNAAIIAATCLP